MKDASRQRGIWPSWTQSPSQEQTCCSVPPLVVRRNGMMGQEMDGSFMQIIFFKQIDLLGLHFLQCCQGRIGQSRSSWCKSSYSLPFKIRHKEKSSVILPTSSHKHCFFWQYYLMNFLISFFSPLVNLSAIQYFHAKKSERYSYPSILRSMEFK